MITWAVTTTEMDDRVVVICQGKDREHAKREARGILHGNPDQYIVEPLTRPDDTVVLKLRIPN